MSASKKARASDNISSSTKRCSIFKNDALSLEYKLKEGCAIGDFDVADAVNNPVAQGIVWIFGDRLQEERFDFIGFEPGSLAENRRHALLIGDNGIGALSQQLFFKPCW